MGHDDQVAAEPLCDPEAERGLLGGLILHPRLLPGVIAVGLTSESFASPGNASAFRALVRVGVDAVIAQTFTVLHDEMIRNGDLPLMGPNGRELVTLMLEALEPKLVPIAAWRVLILGRARQVQRALRAAQDRVERDPVSAREVLVGIGRTA